MGHYECRRCDQRYDLCTCFKSKEKKKEKKPQMKIPTIKDVMREQAKFVKYETGNLWYQIIWLDSDRNPHLFDFPVDVQDAGEGEFTSSEKALTLMRWIRLHIEFLNAITTTVTDESGNTIGKRG